MNISEISKKIPENRMRDFQDNMAIGDVLGCIAKQPSLLRVHQFELNDFVDTFYQIVYAAMVNMIRDGANKIEPDMIATYLENYYPAKYVLFKNHDGIKYMQDAIMYSTIENFEMNYTIIKKWSLLRALRSNGIDVSEYYDPDEFDDDVVEMAQDKFNGDSLQEIIDFYKSKILKIDNVFNSSKISGGFRAGGEDDLRQKNIWKKAINHGISYASNYLTTITSGIQPHRFIVNSASSGVGKTRMAIANVCHSFAPKFWDSKKEKWIDNPNGTQNSALFICTEMDLRTEVCPIIWAYMADVPEDHILLNEYEEGEEERVEQAINFLIPTKIKTNKDGEPVLDEKGNPIMEEQPNGIYLEYMPEFTADSLEQIIEKHHVQHNVTAVFFDYIHSNPSLIAEYQATASNKMSIREDQVLGNLSSRLKEITRKYDVSIDSATQVSGDFKNDQNRDETIVRGAKSIIDKTDVAMILSRPTQSELRKLDNIIHTPIMIGKKPPNVCISVYKNRGGKYNRVKIWLDVNYSTMRVHDLFCTDYEYSIIDVNKTVVFVDEDQKIHVFANSKEMEKYQNHEIDSLDSIKDEENIQNNEEDLNYNETEIYEY